MHVEIRDIKQEIASLVAQLKRDQDPTKMGRIQAQIGVCPPHPSPLRLHHLIYCCASGKDELTIQDLMLQINVIREKAAEAEAIVKSITTDVQRLDVAKRNLTSSIQTLERWDMLRELNGLFVARTICPVLRLGGVIS